MRTAGRYLFLTVRSRSSVKMTAMKATLITPVVAGLVEEESARVSSMALRSHVGVNSEYGTVVVMHARRLRSLRNPRRSGRAMTMASSLSAILPVV
jgi:hypothetical protein